MIDVPELLDLIPYWQDVLHLRDWEITARYVRRAEMGGDSWGALRVFQPKRNARILILHPEDRQHHREAAHDWCEESVEQSLVHELLHIHLWEWAGASEGAASVAEEQAVHAIASALVTLRGG